ncbi:hypothetical protein DMH04_24195 [Kibdelosporangium aridum]|uniref:Uncharacterized protein n=1 Tax=Kibdelosporangium aridum TaxID=2030 RepID=A0A428Z741_KIBAR|nr:hypothetical protein [Kibdelosporangium aridum]RSM83228.1 hypothetical protein DMH04_24195 [Kibdelosporangium aridum]
MSADPTVETDGRDVINQAGTAALRLIANRTGLTAVLSRALARRGFTPVHDRVEASIRCGKNTGLGHLPSTSIAINRARCVAATISIDLLCWLRLLCLDGVLAKAEPKPCATGCCTPPPASSGGQRKRRIRIPDTLPWTEQLATRLRVPLALSPPTRC